MSLDLALALMPIKLIRTLHRTLREKILICCLMAMGLFATGIAGYKMTLSTKAFKGDPLSTTVELSLWNKLEELVGMTAASLPCLKSSAERLLRRVGVLSTRVGLTKPSFVISYQEHSAKAAGPAGGGTRSIDSLHRCEENAFGTEMMTAESKGSIPNRRAESQPN